MKTIRLEKNKAGKGLAITGQVLGLVSMLIGLKIWFCDPGGAVAIVIDAISLVLFIIQFKRIKKANVQG